MNGAGDEAEECCIKMLLFDPHAHAINESDNTPHGRNGFLRIGDGDVVALHDLDCPGYSVPR
jgi:hypothetical protein